MPSDYELRAGRAGEGEEAIAVRVFELAGEAVSLIQPTYWRLAQENFLEARFAIPEPAGATLTVSLDSYEDAPAIATNDLERYLSLPGLPPLDSLLSESPRDAAGVPDFEQLTLRLGGTISDADPAGQPDAMRRRRKLGLLRPHHIRVLAAELQIPAAAGSSAAQELGT